MGKMSFLERMGHALYNAGTQSLYQTPIIQHALNVGPQ